MLNPTIQHEIWIAAPIGRVWEAISQTEQIARWWGGSGLVHISDLRAGATIDFATSDGVISATITRVEPPTLLVYEWPPHPRYFMVPFVTSYALRQQDGGVLLRFTESGFAAWPDDDRRRERYERLTEGFATLLGKLKDFVEGEVDTKEYSMSTERIVQTNKVDICIQTFGDSTHPAILLIHGATASMLSWEDEFCQRLATGGRFVIRYDQRDTGQSVTYKPGQPPYSVNDLMEDAIGILHALNLSNAHIVGRSMGGSIAILAALHHPNYVNTLTLMATSPGGADLSPPADTFLAHMHGGQQPDWADREAVIEYIMALLTVFDGGTAHFDRRAICAHAAREVDRATNIASSQLNHFIMDLGEPVRHRLEEITTPTLVIHGARDPVFPLDHGQTIAAEIPNADLLILPGSGHLVLAPSWDQVVPAILSHTGAAT